MVYVMVTVKYPPHKTQEVLDVYLSGKAAKYPDFVKRIHQLIVSDYNFKSYNLYEIPEDKLYQGIKAIGKRYSTYVAVEGYKYKIEPLIEGSEAIQLIRG